MSFFIYQMERVGVKADIAVLEQLAKKLDRKIIELESDMKTISSHQTVKAAMEDMI